MLKARKKFGFVDRTIQKLGNEDDDIEDWWANNAMVVSWLKLTIDEKLQTSLSHH